ncbi:transposase [Kaistella jeonii]|uniref:Transposase n=5 Tax=Kaistella jeonii TaxID=266749 RepID=A0A0C1F6G1_9FLAO|nr:transposase [Kaistella jeonii]KIA88777.1 transposase [Kaistella jeonii]VEI96513.1 Transposase [Kaistella jeonii]VEI96934.1 Transposase [Kaistella jeonii]VEI97266.1 Transposase [Kaistella jeonii]VEI97320.1 Transposase [Kaistella jeonii]
MRKIRRKFDGSFKAKVVIEALKERETLQQLALKFELHPNQISIWKQEFLQNSALIFEDKVQKEISDTDVSELYAKIGKLEMEKEFLKKNLKRFGL